MHAKILIWTGVGVIAVTITILLVWLGLAGLLPRISFQVDLPEVNWPPVDYLILKGLDMLSQAIAVSLQLIASFIYVSSQQIIDAFQFPFR